MALASELELVQPGTELVLDLDPDNGVHAQRGESESPIDAVDTEISRLDGIGHVRGDKERRRDNPSRSEAARAVLAK